MTTAPVRRVVDARRVTAHAAMALRTHRELQRRNHSPLPAGYDVLESLFLGWARDDSAVLPVPPPISRQALTIEEAAASVGVSISTMRRKVADGEVPSIKIAGSRRIRVEALRAWLQSLEQGMAA